MAKTKLIIDKKLQEPLTNAVVDKQISHLVLLRIS